MGVGHVEVQGRDAWDARCQGRGRGEAGWPFFFKPEPSRWRMRGDAPGKWQACDKGRSGIDSESIYRNPYQYQYIQDDLCLHELPPIDDKSTCLPQVAYLR